MAKIVMEKDGIFGCNLLAAVPVFFNLEAAVNKSPVKGKFFPCLGFPDFIDGKKAILESGGVITDLTATFSNKPDFCSQVYDLHRNLDGYTTLDITSVGNSKEEVAKAAQNFIALFPEAIDLDMTSVALPKFEETFYSMLRSFKQDMFFFNKFRGIRRKITDLDLLETKRVDTGVFADIFSSQCGKQLIVAPSDEERKYDFRLINRTEGYYGNILVEAALVHLSGEGIDPGIYGTILSTKYNDCPEHGFIVCDEVKSFAGMFMKSDSLLLGGSVKHINVPKNISEKMLNSGVNLSLCARLIHSAPLQASWFKIEEFISYLGNDEGPEGMPRLSFEQIEEIKTLTNIVYHA